MNDSTAPPFRPVEPDTAGVLSWAHIGDLHMTLDGEQNHHDLRAIVAEIQGCFAHRSASSSCLGILLMMGVAQRMRWFAGRLMLFRCHGAPSLATMTFTRRALQALPR